MFNNYQKQHTVKVRKRAVNSEKDDSLTTKNDHIDKQFSSKININSFILFLILALLLYFNSSSITERLVVWTSQTTDISSHSLPTNNNLRNVLATTTAVSNAIKPEPVTYKRNEKIDWDGCLFEIPPPDPNRKHMVPPPHGPITLVCCNTTVGVLNIEVHHNWAYNGANRFMEMVRDGFFSTKVGLFRALKGFLVQFGLAGDPALQTKYHQKGNLRDDANWLPEGPSGREINGTKRFQQGYLAYAGAGVHSRGTQLIMAFQPNAFLAGGSPWEVPWGQLFGADSYVTLSKIYTGYGEKPSQGKIMNRGSKYLEEEFPLLDYITKCEVTREGLSD